MNTESVKEEPLTMENVMRFIKQQTIEFRQQLCQQTLEFCRQLDEERKKREEAFAAEDKRRMKYEAEARAEHKQIRSEIGGIGKSNGEYAEQFFLRALKRTNSFGGVKYNRVDSNWNTHTADYDEEYDIILHNGDSLVLIEVKYRFKMDEFAKFIGRKLAHFRKSYNVYADKKLYLGIAGFSFEKGVVEKAREMGIAVLQKDGKNVDYEDTNLKEF